MTKAQPRVIHERIVRFGDTSDAGEFGATVCPHCGAKGRYVLHFTAVTDDGEIVKRAAMRGCVKLWGTSKIAEEERKIRERQADREKTGGKLASWDVTKLDKIEAFYAGKLTEGQCLAWIDDENRKRDQWMKNRGR